MLLTRGSSEQQPRAAFLPYHMAACLLQMVPVHACAPLHLCRQLQALPMGHPLSKLCSSAILHWTGQHMIDCPDSSMYQSMQAMTISCSR